jgi:catecholate siderophore receptor
MRDPAFYDRDTFNLDRLEVLRGSASMLFGRGSTGGAVNQVSKVPRLMDSHQVDVTLGSHSYRRITGDFNLKLGENAALRVNVMATKADNNGAGSSIDKGGWPALTAGAWARDEFWASLYYLDNHNGINYGLPWIRPNASSAVDRPPACCRWTRRQLLRHGQRHNRAAPATAPCRTSAAFDDGGLIKSQFRVGNYERDQRASTIRLCQGTTNPNTGICTPNAACPTWP